MEEPNNIHSADGSILGFFFQIERALIWLSSLSNDAMIGVEVDDDITVRLEKGQSIKTIYEQAKHSQTGRAPFSDQSIDLWKTLKIWIDAVTSNRMNTEHSLFSLFTNKKLPATRFVHDLSRATLNDKQKMQEVIEKLKSIALKLPKSMKEYADSITNCPEITLSKIVDRIVVFDGTYQHNSKDHKMALKANLSLSDDLPFDYIYRGLLGFVTDHLTEKWKLREPGWVSVSAFTKQYSQLVSDFKKKSFYEQTVDSLPVGHHDIEENKGKMYVRQLHQIGCTEDEVIEAIHDFVRAASERSRIAEDGDISHSKFELYFDDLLSYWRTISRPKFKFSEKDKKEQVGYEVYNTCLSYKGKLNNYEPEQGYTYRGTYHHLADETKLGWHPDWQTLKEKK